MKITKMHGLQNDFVVVDEPFSAERFFEDYINYRYRDKDINQSDFNRFEKPDSHPGHFRKLFLHSMEHFDKDRHHKDHKYDKHDQTYGKNHNGICKCFPHPPFQRRFNFIMLKICFEKNH